MGSIVLHTVVTMYAKESDRLQLFTSQKSGSLMMTAYWIEVIGIGEPSCCDSSLEDP